MPSGSAWRSCTSCAVVSAGVLRPGELLGSRQTGLIGLKIADPVRDAAQIAPLQKLADDWLGGAVKSGPKDAKRLIARWVGDAERYAQV